MKQILIIDDDVATADEGGHVLHVPQKSNHLPNPETFAHFFQLPFLWPVASDPQLAGRTSAPHLC